MNGELRLSKKDIEEAVQNWAFANHKLGMRKEKVYLTDIIVFGKHVHHFAYSDSEMATLTFEVSEEDK